MGTAAAAPASALDASDIVGGITGALTGVNLSQVGDIVESLTTLITALPATVQSIGTAIGDGASAMAGTLEAFNGTVEAMNNGINALSTGFENMSGLLNQGLDTINNISDNHTTRVVAVTDLGSDAVGLGNNTVNAVVKIDDNHVDLAEKTLDVGQRLVPDVNKMADRIGNNIDNYIVPDTHDFVSNIINEDGHITTHAAATSYAESKYRQNMLKDRALGINAQAAVDPSYKDTTTQGQLGGDLNRITGTELVANMTNVSLPTGNGQNVVSNVLGIGQTSAVRTAIKAAPANNIQMPNQAARANAGSAAKAAAQMNLTPSILQKTTTKPAATANADAAKQAVQRVKAMNAVKGIQTPSLGVNAANAAAPGALLGVG